MLCLTALAAPQATVSITLPATRLPAIAKALSEHTGRKVEVDRTVPDTPLVISVKAVPLETLLEKIALASGTDVVKVDDAYRLIRTPKRLSDLRENERLQLETAWTQGLTERRKLLEKEPWTAESAKRWYDRERRRIHESADAKYGLNELKPTARLLLRLLELIGPKELSRHRGAQATVFSRYPNAMQRPFPKSIEPLLATFARETQLNPQRSENDPWIGFTDLRTPIAKLHLKITTDLPEAWAALKIYDQKGVLGEEALIFVGPLDTTESRFSKIEPFTPSRDAIEELSFLPDAAFESKLDALAPPLVKRWLSPETDDPVPLAASEAMIDVASQKKLNLVSALPDWVRAQFLKTAEGRIDPSQFLNMLSARPLDLQIGEGWLVGVPRWPLADEERRIPRSQMGAFVRRVDRNGSDLDTEAAFAAGLSSTLAEDRTCLFVFPVNQYLEARYGGTVWSKTGGALLLQRFLGRLTPTHRQQLARGESLLASSLQPKELPALGDVTYTPGMLEFADREYEMVAHDEPTEALPNGIPPQTRISMRSSVFAGFRFEGEPFSPKFFGLAKLVEERQAYKLVDHGEEFIHRIVRLKVKPTREQTHELLIDYGSGIKQTATFEYFRSTGKEVDPLSVPELRVAIEATKKEFATLDDNELFRELLTSWRERL